MRLHRSFRGNLNCVSHELSVFHRHGVDDDYVPTCRSPAAAGAPFLLNFVSEQIITSTLAFVLVSTVTDSPDT
jgi:hypothetical protein